MLLSGVLNVFIGLALTFAAVSLVVSSISESLASLFKLRANTLVSGLKALLNDPDLNGLAAQVLNHAAVNPRATNSSGDAKNASSSTSYSLRPSYIPPMQFASALLDVLHEPGAAAGAVNIESIIKNLGGDSQLKTLLQGMYDRGATDITTLRKELSDWFDSAMDRASGAYKRQAQLISFLIGLAIAVGLNIDALHLARTLWSNPDLAATIPNIVNSAQALQHLEDSSFPFGWEAASLVDRSCLVMVLGWLVTALSTLYGAPFWFDTLQRFVQLKGTGPAPADASPAPAAKP